MTIPPKIGEGGGGFFGRPLRDLWIAGLGIALSVVLGLWMPGPVWLKIAVAILVAGLGLAIGLGRDQGVWRFEERVAHIIRHRMRRRRRVWRRRTPDEVPVASMYVHTPVPEPADLRQGYAPVPMPVDLGWGIITTFVLSLMGGVTAYLAMGGARDVVMWWRLVSGQ